MTINKNGDNGSRVGSDVTNEDEANSLNIVRRELAALDDPKRGRVTEEDVAVLEEAGLEELAEIAREYA